MSEFRLRAISSFSSQLVFLCPRVRVRQVIYGLICKGQKNVIEEKKKATIKQRYFVTHSYENVTGHWLHNQEIHSVPNQVIAAPPLSTQRLFQPFQVQLLSDSFSINTNAQIIPLMPPYSQLRIKPNKSVSFSYNAGDLLTSSQQIPFSFSFQSFTLPLHLYNQ